MAKENLNKLTVKALREILVKLGMPKEATENFENKKPIIATIQVLRANATIGSGQLKKDRKEYLSKKERMRAILMAQPRIRILIPTQGTEKPGVVKWVYNKRSKRDEQVLISGAYTPVQINGFKWLVPHGVYSSVPEQIAEAISDSQNMTNQAGKEYLLDRDDPKTGKTVRDAME